MKNIKVERIIIVKHFITQDINWTENSLNITFKAEDYNLNNNRFLGRYEVEYKGLRITKYGEYAIGEDIRGWLEKALDENRYIKKCCKDELTEAEIAIYDMLIKISPTYMQFS